MAPTIKPELLGEGKLSRSVSKMILTMLLIAMFTLAFDVQPIKAVFRTRTVHDEGLPNSLLTATSNGDLRNCDLWQENTIRHHSALPDRLNLNKLCKRSDFACADDDSIELVIGINDEHSTSELTELMKLKGCYLVNEILIKNKPAALVVDVPLRALSSFTTDVITTDATRYVEPNIVFNASILPNDDSWKRQWGPIKIESPHAWNQQIGNASVLVAIVDSGVDWDHPDLTANYVPLGYDWVNGDPDPMDDVGHGTHCAGIVAATLSNGIGIAGLAQVSIMAEKALNNRGIGYADWLANGIIHAVDQGAEIVSMSWGGFVRSELIYDAVKYAYDNGVLLVGAAGNDETDHVTYPASFEEVIAVAATDQFDDPAYFTNFGDWIELAAPGVDIYSTLWNDSYDYMSGTSMACPHVAGVAALIWGQFPHMSRDQVRSRLRQTADDLGDSGFDEYYGYGRINAKTAVEKPLPEHDLLIEHWEPPAFGEPGKSVKINGTILDFGRNHETGITIQLLVNGSEADTTSIGSMDSNVSQRVTLLWSPTVEGIYNVTIHVLPALYENIVRNNFFSACVPIRAPQVISVPEDSPTIESAVNAAHSGDTVLVSAGTYYEHVLVKKSLKLIGESRETTTINGNGSETILRVETTDNVFITGFSINNGSIGISLYNSHSVTLSDNDLYDNDWNLQVSGHSLHDFIQDIDASNRVNGRPVCYLVNQKNRWVSEDAGYVGLINSTNINVKDLCLNESIFLAYTSDSCIKNLTVSSAFYGAEFYWSNNNTIRSSFLLDNTHGISLRCSRNNAIVNNNVTSNLAVGIWLSRSSVANEIDSNIITRNTQGIYIVHSGKNLLVNNTMIDNQFNFGVDGSFLSHFIQDIDASNVVDGKKVYYLVNQKKNLIIDTINLPDAGYVAVVNSTKLTIQDLNLRNNVQGALLAYTSDLTVKNLNVSQNAIGILLFRSNNDTVCDNVASSNWHGIDLDNAKNNKLSNNTIESNGQGAIYVYMSDNNTIAKNTMVDIALLALGIELSSENTIAANEILNSSVALAFGLSNCNSVHANNLTNNEFAVMFASLSCDDNVFYHNSFISNPSQVQNFFGSKNVWDNGYPSGGNYWSDYAGDDLKRGSDQDMNGSDGVGDTAYVIDINNRDRYPLMKPWIVSLSKGPGDINGDGKVDIYDVVLAAVAYGSTPEDPNWNPVADLAPPYGKIDIYDMVTILSNYGKEYL